LERGDTNTENKMSLKEHCVVAKKRSTLLTSLKVLRNKVMYSFEFGLIFIPHNDYIKLVTTNFLDAFAVRFGLFFRLFCAQEKLMVNIV
jgi:hypothetical protein